MHPAIQKLLDIRQITEQLCKPLNTEDCIVQPMPDASPTIWHLGHTTWFIEMFIISKLISSYIPYDKRFTFIFNSYYESVGERQPRPIRGLLTRPTLKQVYDYRHHINEALKKGTAPDKETEQAIYLAANHEQQHQELILTDIKYTLATQPFRPAYMEQKPPKNNTVPQAQSWHHYPEGIQWIGFEGKDFAYDNEKPRHRAFVDKFSLSSRLVTCGEYLEFILDGGYRRPEFWLSEGWYAVQTRGWKAPLYWHSDDGKNFYSYSLIGGEHPVYEHQPVHHVSYFEADAYARWKGAHLPTEEEWETAAEKIPLEGSFLDPQHLMPNVAPKDKESHPSQMFGEVWQWTQSSYSPYKGFVPFSGQFGEYNGKFMCNQYVLRGGSCFTPKNHMRVTYRNFFAPDARWQMSGIRLTR